jgi:hypothetical protein
MTDVETFKYERTFVFHLNSNNRINGNHQDFEIKVDITNGKIVDYDSVVVLSASVPKSYYAIEDGRNTIDLIENSTTTTISITPGTYSASDFTNLIQGLLNDNSSQGWTYAMSINLSTAKYTISVSGNGGNQPSINPKEVYEKFGLLRNTITAFTGDSLTSINVVDMSPENDIFIHSNISRGSNTNDDILIDLFGSGVPPFGRIQFFNPEPDQYAKDLNTTSDVYRFYITDEDGNIKNLNGVNWTATLLFFKKSTIPQKIKDVISLMAETI